MKPGQFTYRLFSLIFLASFGVVIIALLYLFSEHANHRPNGFIRLFPPHPISARYYKNLEISSYYFAGITNESIYLNNQSGPAYLLVLDHDLENSHFLKFSVPKGLLFTKGTVITHVDSPDIKLDSYKNSLLLSGNLSSMTLNILDNKMDYFKCEPISSSSYIFRIENANHNQNLIAKRNYTQTRTDTSDILDPTKQGVIKTDGFLFFDKNSNHIFYIYYYQNRFFCLDSNLNLTYAGRTIDTIGIPHIKISKIISENKVTLGAPPLQVNINASSNGKWLFIQSALTADNELRDLDRGSVIDVYSVDDGKYKLSFNLPDYEKDKLKYFKAFKNELIALYDHTIFMYKLNF